MTLSEQKTSGLLGLGFPRLSVLAHNLLEGASGDSSSSATSAASSASGNATGASSSTASSSAAASSASTSYLPTLLESLVTIPQIPYPVFAIGLTEPKASTSSASSAKASASSRFQTSIGSLTLGGVSGQFVSKEAGSGRTLDDIEWHDVIPFSKATTEDSVANVSAVSTGLTTTAQAKRQEQSASASGGAAVSGSALASVNATSTTSAITVIPTSLQQLEEEEYLHWVIELRNISYNGSDVDLSPTYADRGIPSLALLDIGFTGISGPMDDVARIFDKVRDARQISTGQWIAPCDTKATLGFSFGGRYVQLQPSDWLYASIASSSFCLAYPIGTRPSADGIDWQLGTPFLRKVYSIYSYGINNIQAPLVGFLPLESDAVSSIESSSGASAAQASATASSEAPASAYGPTPTSIAALDATTTVKTNIPNALLTTASYSRPSYAYEQDSSLTSGVLQSLGLANASAYAISQPPIYAAPNTSTMTASMSSDGGSPVIGSTDQGSSAAAVVGAKVDLRGVGGGWLGGLVLGALMSGAFLV